MSDLRLTIAKNISSLRKEAEMTQFELAERLNYSDKAISKWERGESIPDVIVLKEIADIFSVSVDYLLEEEHKKRIGPSPNRGRRFANRSFITGMSVTLVWLVFLWAVPPTFIVWLVLNSVWFNRRRNFLIVSLLMWSILVSIHISLIILLQINVRFIYLLGIPGQVIILFWSGIKRK